MPFFETAINCGESCVDKKPNLIEFFHIVCVMNPIQNREKKEKFYSLKLSILSNI